MPSLSDEEIEQLAKRIISKIGDFIESHDCDSRTEDERETLREEVGYSFYCAGCGEGLNCDRSGIAAYIKSSVIKELVVSELKNGH